jgi:GWxTD domain-containing protein
MTGLFLALALGQAAPLSDPHRLWLEEEVHFLISNRERREFLALDSQQARSRFIENFWLRRDPTPGTAGNEFRQRHVVLLAEADRLFTLMGSRRGRFTERGRIYQLLGPPQSRSDYARAGNRLFPLELWHYTGVTEKFLPGTFYLIFFREGGFGDYRLWSPTADGPQGLVQVKDPGRFYLDSRLAYDELERIDLELANAARALVPGGAEDLPAFAAESLLTNLKEYSDISERRLRPEVTAQVTFQELPASGLAVALADSTGIPLAHVALEVPAARVSWVGEGGRQRTGFELSCAVSDVSGREVEAFSDRIELELSQAEHAALETTALSFQGRLVLAPGSYTVELRLINITNGAGESLVLPLEIPDAGRPGASSLLLSRFRSRPGNALREARPFEVSGALLSPNPAGVFPATEAVAHLQLWGLKEAARLEWALLRGERVLWQSQSEVSPASGPVFLVEQVVPLASLAAGDYQLRVRHPSGESRARLHLDPALPASAVRVVAREGLPAGDGRIRFLRGTQFAKQGEPARAIEEMAEAARLLPRDLEVHLKLAFLLNATGQHQRVVDLLVPLAPHHPTEPDVWIFLGFASQKLGRLAEAVAYYEKAVALRPEDARLKGALEEVRRLRASSPRP